MWRPVKRICLSFLLTACAQSLQEDELFGKPSLPQPDVITLSAFWNQLFAEGSTGMRKLVAEGHTLEFGSYQLKANGKFEPGPWQTAPCTSSTSGKWSWVGENLQIDLEHISSTEDANSTHPMGCGAEVKRKQRVILSGFKLIQVPGRPQPVLVAKRSDGDERELELAPQDGQTYKQAMGYSPYYREAKTKKTPQFNPASTPDIPDADEHLDSAPRINVR